MATVTPKRMRILPSVFRLLILSTLLGALSGCTRFSALDATIPSCSYTLTRGIPYGDDPRQTLDVYRPRHAKAPADVVIFFYGGDWQNGSKEDYRFVAEALASRGFVAVMPDYRLYPQVVFPGFVEDGAKAVRWAHNHADQYGGDPAHLFLMGHSAGAHIAALLTLDAHYLQDVGLDDGAISATVSLSGPYDFIPPKEDRAPLGMAPGDLEPAPVVKPIHFVRADAPPMLLVHGARDTTVVPGNAQRLMGAMHAVGGEVTYLRYPTLGHVGVILSFAWPFRWMAPILDESARYMHAHEAPRAATHPTTR